MILKTYGHATLSLEQNNKPFLITDPWLIGSCYWRSWWLQHYPNEKDLSILKNAEIIFLTHEHWDHAHFPSLKNFFKNKKILIPSLNSKRLKFSLEKDFEVTELKPYEWIVYKEIKILSIPLWNDDSILLFNWKNYLVCNLNDSKPTKSILGSILRYKKKNNCKLILLQSYAPASIVNSFRNRYSETISIKEKEDYINYVKRTCIYLQSNFFIPFASQAVYSRPDSVWANKHKVTDIELHSNWNLKTILLKSYSSFDLKNNIYYTYVENYKKSENMEVLAKKEYDAGIMKECNLDDLNVFSRITNPGKYLLFILYPFGLNFKFGNKFYNFNFLTGKFSPFSSKKDPAHYFSMPVKEFYESCLNLHFTDTGTSFILKIYLKNKLNIFQSYMLFIILTFSEKGYLSNLKMLFSQFLVIYRNFNSKPL
jgi:UDP-MurNAc hydroxylase